MYVGFTASDGKGAREILPPTIKTPSFPTTGLSFTTWLDDFSCHLAVRSRISCGKTSFWTKMTTSIFDFSSSSSVIYFTSHTSDAPFVLFKDHFIHCIKFSIQANVRRRESG